jgi:hypothetical protein
MGERDKELLTLAQRLEESERQYRLLQAEYLQLLAGGGCPRCAGRPRPSLQQLLEQVQDLHLLIDDKQQAFARALEARAQREGALEAELASTREALRAVQGRLAASLTRGAQLEKALVESEQQKQELTEAGQKLVR